MSLRVMHSCVSPAAVKQYAHTMSLGDLAVVVETNKNYGKVLGNYIKVVYS